MNLAGQETPAARAADEQTIRKLLAIYVETWNRHDMEAWGKLFTDDVDFVNRGGGWWRSNNENVQGHKAIHDMLVRQNQKMNYESAVARIAFLKPDIALVHASWEWPGFTLPPGDEATDFKGIITMVMVKQDNRWLIRASHNTVTTMPPTAERPTSVHPTPSRRVRTSRKPTSKKPDFLCRQGPEASDDPLCKSYR